MQYIVTFIWSFLLVSMLNYVVSSVLGVPFDFKTGAIVSVVFSILIFIIEQSFQTTLHQKLQTIINLARKTCSAPCRTGFSVIFPQHIGHHAFSHAMSPLVKLLRVRVL